MGASQSRPKNHQEKRKGYAVGPSEATPHLPAKAPPPRGKTTPPSQPVASDVTHNSLTLSWLPPRRNSGSTVFAYTIEMSTPSDPKAWTVTTKTCQGNSHQVKNLAPNSQYMFRVRAENIHGLSKASQPSEVVETKIFGVEQQLYTPAPEEKVRSAPRPQHSINLHLEGTVTAILNHTDIQVKTNSSREVKGDCDSEEGSLGKGDGGKVHRSLEALGRSDEVDSQGLKWKSSSLQRDLHTRSSLQTDRHRPNTLQRDSNSRSSLQPDRWRSNSLQREAYQRTSLQPSRKRSLPILLPGTRTDSLNKLRDSQFFPATCKNRLNDSTDSSRRRGHTWRDRSASDVDSRLSESPEIIMEGKKCSALNESTTDTELKPPKRDSGLEEDAENPWERDDSSSEASEGMVSPAGTIDKKVELYPLSDTPSSPPRLGVVGLGGLSPGGEGGQADFRMLRSLLHSDDIIVTSSHSLPEVISVGRKISPHNTLTTIMDLEEEDESVRITTL